MSFFTFGSFSERGANKGPSRPGNEASTDFDAKLSRHSSEKWSVKVPDNFKESSEEEVSQAWLDKAKMNEDDSPFAGSDGRRGLVRKVDGVDDSAQAQAVNDDDKFKKAGDKHVRWFRAIEERYRRDGERDKRLTTEELTDILDWSKDDNRAAFGLIEDPDGTYVRTAKHTFTSITGKGAVLERASRTNQNNGSFKVVKAKRA